MCELSFADLGELNAQYFVQQSIINALANNHDGIGWMQEGKIWKSCLSGARITNLGSLAKDGLTTAPLAFHTRYATNKLLNEDCHSHPFSGDKLILMHNGKIERKDCTLIGAGKVDSQVFTEELEEIIVDTPDIPMVDLMQTVMDKWCGKFAFMIYDTRDSTYYVIRGTTADLHWTTVNKRLIVNTQKIDLDKGTHALRQLSQVIDNEDLEIGEIEALKTNTIYKFNVADSVLEEVGEVTENKAPLVASMSWVDDRRYSAMAEGSTRNIRTMHEPISEKLKRWMDFHCMSLGDLNVLSHEIMGSSLLELTDNELRCFYLDVLKVLTEHSQTEGLRWWGQIVEKGYSSWAYLQDGFSFPWMLNTTSAVSRMVMSMDVEITRRKKEIEDKAKIK